MFCYENLEVYSKAKQLYKSIFKTLFTHSQIDLTIQNQLKRAALSIMLNIAEGSGRTSRLDQRHFYTIARGSAFEVAAILNLMEELYPSIQPEIKELYSTSNVISHFLYRMMQKLSTDEEKQRYKNYNY